MEKIILNIPNNQRQNLQTWVMYIGCKGEYIKMEMSALHMETKYMITKYLNGFYNHNCKPY